MSKQEKPKQVAIEFLDKDRTLPLLNKFKADFGIEVYNDFFDYVANDCEQIHNNKEDIENVVYVPNFVFINYNKEETKSKYKGFGITYGVLVGYVSGSKQSYINCGLNISFYKPYVEHPDDTLLDEYSRIKNLLHDDLPQQELQERIV